ncbi:NAD(P)-dependent oxidoreductase [Anaerotignum sp.]|uniref:NAD(P)-dependent oxidoreductase n=1 Tax=Anaerotignum sp. TaxID=2039241 RepID=UPI002A90C0CC|nr:NAD(P)-dependent oxidoreductase [Anaerotignum sp.]MDY5414960.1 NAD(P)-dependent oxidoreductase [Anaerotignum sp.]
MKKIGFIGIGVMGYAMAENLMKKGYEVSVYTRTKQKAETLLEKGAKWCDTAADCARGQEAVITMVGFPKDVEEVYFGETGIFAAAEKGAYLIDMTTTSPKLSVKIYDTAKERNMYALDAPVSGGDTGAKNGTLSIMVGGDQEAFDVCYEIFAAMGTNIIYEGPAGSGQHTKMANQIALGGAISGVCEALAYAKAVGLDQQTMLDSISAGAAGSWQMTNMAPRILKGDDAPGFYIKHYIKDMRIAVEESQQVELDLKMLHAVLDMYEKLAAFGMADLGTQALYHYYDEKE